MRVCIITAEHLRHKYFANTICEAFGPEVVAIISERKFYDPNSAAIQERYMGDSDEKSQALWDWHFSLRDASEKKYFKDHEIFINADIVKEVESNHLNDPNTVAYIQDQAPEVIAVFGSGLLKKELIALPPLGVVNNHLGLSPYYRGSGTNFWPLHNGEPGYVGATVHFVDEGVDSGDIIYRGRPRVSADDNQHDIGNKAIKVGTHLVIQALRDIESGTCRSYPQADGGKVYKREDFSAASIKTLKQKLEAGMIETFVKENMPGPDNVPIVDVE